MTPLWNTPAEYAALKLPDARSLARLRYWFAAQIDPLRPSALMGLALRVGPTGRAEHQRVWHYTALPTAAIAAFESRLSGDDSRPGSSRRPVVRVSAGDRFGTTARFVAFR